MNASEGFQKAIQQFWDIRAAQSEKQRARGRIDAGTRGTVTGGRHLLPMEELIAEVLIESGLERGDIWIRKQLQIPGYYRSTKQWDLLIVSNNQFIGAIEFKSIVGSFSNNLNNRAEEAIGNADDLWTAYREGRFGTGPRPFLGYFFLLQDCNEVHRPVGNKEPHFRVDPAFKDASYAKRTEVLCRRLIWERLYDTACLTLSTDESPTRITHPADDLSFDRFIGELRGHTARFIGSQR